MTNLGARLGLARKPLTRRNVPAWIVRAEAHALPVRLTVTVTK